MFLGVFLYYLWEWRMGRREMRAQKRRGACWFVGEHEYFLCVTCVQTQTNIDERSLRGDLNLYYRVWAKIFLKCFFYIPCLPKRWILNTVHLVCDCCRRSSPWLSCLLPNCHEARSSGPTETLLALCLHNGWVRSSCECFIVATTHRWLFKWK